MERFAYRLSDPASTRARLGLIVLQADETLEQEARPLFDVPGLATYVSRVPSGAAVTPESLVEMQAHLSGAACLLPPHLGYQVIGYGCTSGALMIGPDQVARQVGLGAKVAHVTNPLSAALAALSHLGIGRLAVVTPYVDSVSRPLCDRFETEGVEVTRALSFGEAEEGVVARIDPQSTFEAALQVGSDPAAEAVFLSCTNLRSFSIIEAMEQRLGKPVLSSNQVLFWHMAQLAGIDLNHPPGRLFRSAFRTER